MGDGWKRAVKAARATREDRPCRDCSATAYGHIDHAHERLKREQGRCPFGDCDKYTPSNAPTETGEVGVR